MKKSVVIIGIFLVLCACKNNSKSNSNTSSKPAVTSEVKYPSDVIPFMDKFKILTGDGTRSDSLVGYEKEGFFYVTNERNTDWVVYKTPNSGVTSRRFPKKGAS